MPDSVAVIGGGLAGLAVAHELAARGVPVTVYEARGKEGLGGKCRSQYFASSQYGTLPGEHGFRFFPGWYQHVPHLMRRIPLRETRYDPDALLRGGFQGSVADSLVPSEDMGLSYLGQSMQVVPLGLPPGLTRPAELSRWLIDLWTTLGVTGISAGDAAQLGLRFLKFLATCEARRDAEIDPQSLWEFLRCDDLTAPAQEAMRTLPKALVAMNADEGNARTFLNTLYLMMTEWTVPGQHPHRVLNGPTSKVWLNPWREALERVPQIDWRLSTRVTRLVAQNSATSRVTGLYLDGATHPISHRAYVLAVPLEVAHDILAKSPTVRSVCDASDRLARLDPRACTRTMTGVQLYFASPTNTMKGHFALTQSEWGLTAVSQERFWRPEHLPQGIRGILSLCLTDLTRPVAGIGSLTAQEVDRETLVKGVLWQVRAALGPDGTAVIDEAPVAHHVDDDLEFNPSGVGIRGDRSRLLIHPPGQLAWRPTPASKIENLYFAGDYVRNPVDLATMEGAVCSASMAVNAFLDRTSNPALRCEVFGDYREKLEPAFLRRFKWLDHQLFERGLRAAHLGPESDKLVSPQSEQWLTREIERFETRLRRDAAQHGIALHAENP